MSKSRLELQAMFEAIPGLAHDDLLDGPAVYYQPPATVLMQYPCIRYSYDGAEKLHADDMGYISRPRYSVVVIDPNPDSEIRDRVAELPACRVERPYVADNLYHYSFTIYH